MKRIFLLIILATSCFFLAKATDYYVDATTGSNTTGDGSSGTPWQTITYALNQITGSGHTVYVAAGTYDTTLGETFPILMKNEVSLVGAGIDISIIDANSTNSVIKCISIVDTSTKVEGFTIKGGGSNSGLFISAGSALKIVNNKITENDDGFYLENSSATIVNNTISGNGGNGIYISNSSPLIKGNRIRENTGGNGLYITGSSSLPRIVNNIITKNSGYGIDCYSSSHPRIINNTISENSDDGIYISSASPDSIFNNTISLNSGYGIYESGTTSDPGKVWYNLFYANTSGLYRDEGTTDYYTASSLNTNVFECENNIEGDPMFVDRINDDYHLQAGSPAIDTGDPTFDYSNEPSPNGGRINIGGYGNTTEATTSDAGPPPPPTDIYVDAVSGSNSTGDGTQGNPWQTITYALSHIQGSGYTVYVAAGIYNTTLSETFPILMKNGVSLVGAGIDESIVDADNSNRVIKCLSIWDTTTRLEGFTIKGGQLAYPDNTAGSGLFISAGSSLKIVNNKITNNNLEHHPWSYQRGVGIYIENSSPIIINNAISGNTGDFTEGFGIYILNSSPLIEGNEITGNSGWTGAYENGSGLAIAGSLSSPKVVNNVIEGNGEHGIRCTQSSIPKITNNLIFGNTDDGIQIISSNPGIFNNTISDNGGHGIYVSSTSTDSILNNIISLNSGFGISEADLSSDPGKVWYNLFYANTSGLYLDEGTTDYYTAGALNTGVAECENNIDGDPMFVDRPNGDYNLQLVSPAIDAGDPDPQFNDPDGSRNDIGALPYDYPPAVPQNLSATAGAEKITLRWNPNTEPDLDQYNIYRNLSSPAITLIDSVSSTSPPDTFYVDTGLIVGQDYYYRIKAKDIAGKKSDFSGEVIGKPITGLQQDSLALVALYDSTNGASWTNRSNWLNGNVSTWYGITVSGDRVTQISLESNNLAGTIPPEIGNLTNLTWLGLFDNQLTGSIPMELTNLINLEYLHLTDNQLTGSIPAEIGNLDSLQFLDLSNNLLTGSIPAEIGNLINLEDLRLTDNQLSGSIPIEIGNLTNLTNVSLQVNNLSGSIPIEIGNLTNLIDLYLFINQLTGSIPSEIGSLTNLQQLRLFDNNLSGSIPTEIGNLTNLIDLNLSGNQLTGSIPSVISNFTNLTSLNLAINQLAGSIPSSVGNLINLTMLHLESNQLNGLIPTEIGNLTNLTWLNLSSNQLSGSIPSEIGNLTSLEILHLNENQFTDLPDLSTLDSLDDLSIENNQFTFEDIEPNIGVPDSTFTYSPQDSVGEIIDTTVYVGTSFTLSVSTGGNSSQYQWKKDGTNIGSISGDSTYTINPVAFSDSGTYTCEITNTVATDLTLYSRPVNILVEYSPLQQDSLALIALYDSTNGDGWTNNTNWLTGNVSTWYGITVSVYRVTQIDLNTNNLVGTIPAEIGNLTNLTDLRLQCNQFSGSIPTEIGNLTNLTNLELYGNQLTGSIPAGICNLTNLEFLDLSNNLLTGSIPPEIGNLTNLTFLNLKVNNLSGTIPTEIGDLTLLHTLYLSDNHQLSGSIPSEIGNLTNLQNIDLSFNQLSGAVPNSFTGLTKLQKLEINHNLLTDLPDLASLSLLFELAIANNRFTFEDIEPNIGVASTTFTYSPQDSVGEIIDTTVYVGTSYTMSVSTGGANSQYQWKKDGTNIGTVSSDSTYSINSVAFSDSGAYTCEITNTVATELTLYSRPVNVSVEYPPIYQDSLALVALYNSTDGANWTNNTNWLTGEVSTWYGITVSGDRVTEINLESNNLVGTIPPKIGNLTNLTWLNFGSNQFTGQIPAEIGNLINLIFFDLNINQLSGSIPIEIGNLLNLTHLHLSGNYFTGSIPTEICNLTNLLGLNFDENQLSGSIPLEINNLTNLEVLYLPNNQFTDLPDLSSLVSLNDLQIQNNQFTFNDIEPNIGVASTTFTYSPQDSVGEIIDTTVYVGTSFKLSVSTGGNNSQYQWKKDGTNIGSISSDSTYIINPVAFSDTGAYTCEITNTVATDLTLYSRPVNVSVPSVLNSENDILTYSFAEQTGAATIDAVSHTVDIEVVYGTNLANLVATFSISSQASMTISSVAQISGVTANNFTNPVTYTVTAEDGSTQNWIVTVSEAGILIISDFPYSEDFESGNGGWRTGGINSSWELGNPASSATINSASSGSAAWVTNLTGDYNPDEVSYVTSPQFDLSSLNFPKIEFGIWWYAEGFYDGANLQYKEGTGAWKTLGTDEGNDSWYNSSYIYSIEKGFGFDINNSAGWSGDDEWGYSSDGWVTVDHALTGIDYSSAYVTFRIGFASNDGYENDGVAIDDINIYDDPTGIDAVKGLLSDIQIYPNPNEGKFRLVYKGEKDVDLKLQLINLHGQVVLSEQIETGNRFSKEFELDYLPPGIYYFRLMNKEGVVVKKMVIR